MAGTKEYLLPLSHRYQIAENTMAFRFDTAATDDFSFQAGQAVDLTLVDPPKTDDEGNTRTFSIASSPHHREYIEVATRMRPSAFKENLKTLPLGTRIKVTQAMGSFTLHKNANKPAIFLAGGIGITPMHSMIEWATHEKLPHRLFLFYSNKTPGMTAYLSDLEKWESENPNFKLIATVTGPRDEAWRHSVGRIDRLMLEKTLKDAKEAVYYVAGPPQMVEALRKVLLEAQVDEDSIKSEEFAGY